MEKNSLMDEIVSYLKKNLKKGYTKDSLRWALINQGYSRIEVEKAMKRLDIDLAKKAPILETKPEIKYEVVEPKEEIAVAVKHRPFWKKFLGV